MFKLTSTSLISKAHPLPGRKPVAPAPSGLPLLRLGFRPFYLAAASAAIVLILMWPLVHGGWLVPAGGLGAVSWHAHEMLFGFVVAVVVGFLLTAGRTWTGLPTPRGAHLGALVLLWLAGRVTSVLAPYPVHFLVDLMFLPTVAALFIDLLVRARNLRNLPVAGVMVLLSLANMAFHLGASGSLGLTPLRALHAAVALLVLLVALIAGRVIPMFTMNAVPAVKATGARRRDQLTMALTAVGLLTWVAGLDAVTSALVLTAAAAGHAARLVSWSPWATFRHPIVWILHVGYAWISIGLLMLAASRVGLVGTSAAVHALTVGAMGGLVLDLFRFTPWLTAPRLDGKDG
jgi:uncharacterized protein involved in response to NO